MRPVIIRDDDDEFPPPPRKETRSGNRGIGFVVGVLLLLLFGARSVASFIIDWQWWGEVRQRETWISMLIYRIAPILAAAALAFLVLWLIHARGVKRGGVRLRDFPDYAKISTLLLAVVSLFFAAVTVDAWTIVRFVGGLGATTDGWRDPAFGNPLAFYLFHVPFYKMLLRFLIGLVIVSALVYWVAARGWSLRERFADLRAGGDIDIRELGLGEMLESSLIRIAFTIGLILMAARIFLGRYSLLTQDHGFMVGLDYVGKNVSLPLIWASIAACLVAAVLLWMGRARWSLVLTAAALLLPGLISAGVNAAFVRPSEITIQRDYIVDHIASTRAAFGLDRGIREQDFDVKADVGFDLQRNRVLLDNVRLWDWQAFQDTVTQIQALRPYYVFSDSDVDRYMLPDRDGNMRLQQVLLAPRELDVQRLPDAQTRWINPHFIYTHGYGLVLAEANRITSDGLPLLYIQNAPPQIRTPSLKITRPEIYYGEAVHEPVFVRTAQPEFSYPSGSENVQHSYAGTGGFPIASLPMRFAAALRESDWNIVLTQFLTGESRMMIRRRIRDRLETIASFVDWDRDPYLVITQEGRLVWIVDGYTSSDAHPYARSVRTAFGSLNYVRNSVKATIDAYDGNVNLYIFDPADPIITAYSRLFTKLFKPAAEMPADLRAHARYPEMIFRIQAEMYRTFHMTDPEAFYNKEDLWDIARNTSSQEGVPNIATPTYLMTALPDSDEPEFLLMVPFTPRNKDNLIGLMLARCDGEHLGEIVILKLSKQELIFGPMQIKARINQDQNIAKDLTLWNQQGSKVIRGQLMVLPIDDTFLYVEPIYLQAAQAPMPQLRKVALATGSNIAYADTYQEALRQLAGLKAASAESPPSESSSFQQPAITSPAGDPRVSAARERMRRYRDLLSQGKFAEAGRELEALQELLR
jgi:uncharacterized membrane protein (UPF0182 family)